MKPSEGFGSIRSGLRSRLGLTCGQYHTGVWTSFHMLRVSVFMIVVGVGFAFTADDKFKG